MLGERIQSLRVQKGFTQRELAEKLGVSPSAVGMYEQGRREPDAACLTRMAQVLSVTPDTLLAEEPRELDDVIERLRGRLLLSGDVMFHGQPLTEEDVEAVLAAMKIGARIALEKK